MVLLPILLAAFFVAFVELGPLFVSIDEWLLPTARSSSSRRLLSLRSSWPAACAWSKGGLAHDQWGRKESGPRKGTLPQNLLSRSNP